MRILVVDDDVRLTRQITSALTEAGHDPVVIQIDAINRPDHGVPEAVGRYRELYGHEGFRPRRRMVEKQPRRIHQWIRPIQNVRKDVG